MISQYFSFFTTCRRNAVWPANSRKRGGRGKTFSKAVVSGFPACFFFKTAVTFFYRLGRVGRYPFSASILYAEQRNNAAQEEQA